MGIKKLGLIFIFLILSNWVQAQNDDASKYFLGKSFVEEGRNSLAMETLKPLANGDSETKFREDAAYLYALAAFRDSLFFQSRQMLLQVVSRYDYWQHIDEARYLLAINYFIADNPGSALEYGLQIRNPELQLAFSQAKSHFFSKIETTSGLQRLFEKLPEDRYLAYFLCKRISEGFPSEQELMLMDNLIDLFQFDEQIFKAGGPTNVVYKDQYNVAVLLPFRYSTVHSYTRFDNNKFAYDFYAGLLKAVDTLETMGIKINLRPFDTRKDTLSMRNLLNQNVLLNADLIIGPLYPDLSAMVMTYGKENAITVINPFAQNDDLIFENPYAYLFQPSQKFLHKAMAQFAIDSFSSKDSIGLNMIVMDKTLPDTIAAKTIYEQYVDNGLKIDSLVGFVIENQWQFDRLFAIDTLDSISINTVFVTNNNKINAGRVISSAEMYNSKMQIIGHSRWLEYDNINLHQLERRHVYFTNNDHIKRTGRGFKDFSNQFDFDHLPEFYSCTGYELMLVFGRALQTYGKYFQDGLAEEGMFEGEIFPGFDFSRGNFNAYLPIMKIKDKKLSRVPYSVEFKTATVETVEAIEETNNLLDQD